MHVPMYVHVSKYVHTLLGTIESIRTVQWRSAYGHILHHYLHECYRATSMFMNYQFRNIESKRKNFGTSVC